MIRVLVADDNPVVRTGLTALLEAGGDIEVVAEAGDGRRAVELAELHRPDLVLLDIRMPLMDGVAAAERISPVTPVMILSHTEDSDVIQAAIGSGASGYLVHGMFTAEELMTAVRGVAAGQSNPLSPVAVTALMRAVRRPEPAAETRPGDHRAAFRLSEREAEVMELISQGCANREIAGRLFVSEKTVKNHVNRIFAKLGVENRAAAIAQWLGTAARSS